MKRFSLVCMLMVSLLLFAGLSSTSQACVTCAGLNCVYVTTGHGSCTAGYYPDFPCKLSCPNCPTVPCDPPGGGGGGECQLFEPMSARGQIAANKSVVTTGFLFQTDAATNAKLFGGRGHGYRVVMGGAFGDLSADAAMRTIEGLPEAAAGRFELRQGFTNVNNAGIPVSFMSPDGEGYGFVPATSGLGASLQLKVRGMTKLARAVGNVELTGQDLLLVDVSVHGKAYVLALKSDVLDDTTPDSASRLASIQDSMRRGGPLVPNPYEMPICP